MTYIIAEPCIDIKDRSCVDVCPVDCIHESDRQARAEAVVHPPERVRTTIVDDDEIPRRVIQVGEPFQTAAERLRPLIGRDDDGEKRCRRIHEYDSCPGFTPREPEWHDSHAARKGAEVQSPGHGPRMVGPGRKRREGS